MPEVSEYTNEKVQPKDFIAGWRMAIIIASTALSLPILFLGAEIALDIGLTNAISAFIISTLILSTVSAFTTLVGNRTHLSTYMLLHFSFGKYGARIINFIFGIILIGWFAVALELLAIAISDTATAVFSTQIAMQWIILLCSALITITTLYGIKSIQQLANWTIPFLTAFFIYLLFVSLQNMDLQQMFAYQPEIQKISFFEAISVLVGSSILFPVLMADFSRYMKDDRQSLISVLGLIIGTPIALVFGAIPAITTGEVDIIKIMGHYEMVIPAFVLLFVSTWMTNTLNLYSSVLTFSTIQPKWSYKSIVLLCSFFGTCLAGFEFSNYLFEFLELLGVFTPAIASIYMLNFFWVRKQNYKLTEINKWEIKAICSWLIASVAAVLAYIEFVSFSSVYFLDSFLVGGLSYFILIFLSVKFKKE